MIEIQIIQKTIWKSRFHAKYASDANVTVLHSIILE